MEKLRNRLIILIALMLVSAAVVWAHHLAYGVWRPKADLSLPLKIGDWNGREGIVSDRVYGLLEADTVLIRSYFKKDQEIWFAVVYYKDNQVGFHEPESCFGGLGNQVFDEGTLNLFVPEWKKNMKVNQLHYKGTKEEKILFYFYEVGDFFSDSYFKIRLKMMSEQLKLKRPGVALFELYSPVRNGGTEQARKNLKDFLGYLIPQLPGYLN